MVTSVQIENFKSVVDLSLDLGVFNVMIGENGCGKSNILEAIAFGAAASADKLDHEFLGSRGIRLTNPEFILSAFDEPDLEKTINLIFKYDEGFFENHTYQLKVENYAQKKWINVQKDVDGKRIGKSMELMVLEEDITKRREIFDDIFKNTEDIEKKEKYFEVLNELSITINNLNNSSSNKESKSSFFNFIFDRFLNERFTNDLLSNFIIYSPDQANLRRFEDANQIYPLGVKGEGLFQHLKEIISKKTNRRTISEIRKTLSLLDWYEDFKIPKNLLDNEFSLSIKDKYVYNSLKYFDQRSTNEGFLFLLFYSTLFISKSTPSFFAIDNIDNAFNPKLCTELVKNLVILAKKYNKQVIVTTHNPAILDGLNLEDDSQRLFVVRRNDSGHTKAKRIDYKSDRKMKLSEIWTKGFIGGLPDNF